jgi:hypothetical protein
MHRSRVFAVLWGSLLTCGCEASDAREERAAPTEVVTTEDAAAPEEGSVEAAASALAFDRCLVDHGWSPSAAFARATRALVARIAAVQARCQPLPHQLERYAAALRQSTK